MSSGSYMQAYVRCPFYEWDDGERQITCEGIVDDSSISLSFRKREDFNIHINTFCCQHYDKCEINTLLMAKYEDEPIPQRNKAEPQQWRREPKMAKPNEMAQQISLFDQ